MLKKILIANRGEIAVRIARTAKRMGIKTVAVFSTADREALHVRACDEAILIGGAAPSESYLRADRIIDAVKKTGADAVHPGYGFLSENAAFADKLKDENIIFIGPTGETIRAMGSKSAAKDLMESAGVPTTPGYQGADQSLAIFKNESARIGYPVLLKATAGGGGKGMRVVEDESGLQEALASGQREAISAFGDDRFLVEKYLPKARHLEVQIFGDGHGNVVHLFERDCSVQRRHQKIIEEAPAPALPKNVRSKLLKAGIDAGKAVNYRGAGTVEFLYDGKDDIFFMEMNTRLQVEHPVSEAITGIDLVEWQLQVAAGHPLPREQAEIEETGHAFEARLYAENPDQNFAPSIGTLTTLDLPTDEVRIDSGVEEGQTITPFYDPMIAKIITHGRDRSLALGKMRAALAHTRAAGLETNTRFLHTLCNDADFSNGDVSTKYIDDHEKTLFAHPPLPVTGLAVAIAATMAGYNLQKPDPWSKIQGFRLNRPTKTVFWFMQDGAPTLIRALQKGHTTHVEIERNASAAERREGPTETTTDHFSFVLLPSAGDEIRLEIDSQIVQGSVARHNKRTRIWIDADYWDIEHVDPLSEESGSQASEGSLDAPMPGVITVLSASPGDEISAGDTLIIMEAMKMEHSIKAPYDGIVRSFNFGPGDQVKDGDLLVEFEKIA